MTRINGKKMASEILNGLNSYEQKSILEKISEQDPKLAEILKLGMVTFEDLTFLTPKMFQELLRDLHLGELGLALRAASPKLQSFITELVSSSMKAEIMAVLQGPPRPVSEVLGAQENIMNIVRERLEQGRIVIDKSEQLV